MMMMTSKNKQKKRRVTNWPANFAEKFIIPKVLFASKYLWAAEVTITETMTYSPTPPHELIATVCYKSMGERRSTNDQVSVTLHAVSLTATVTRPAEQSMLASTHHIITRHDHDVTITVPLLSNMTSP